MRITAKGKHQQMRDPLFLTCSVYRKVTHMTQLLSVYAINNKCLSLSLTNTQVGRDI